MAGQGFNAKAVVGLESTYKTAVAATEILPFTSEDLGRAVEKIVNEYLDASVSHKRVQSSVVTVLGNLSLEAVHDAIAGDPIGVGLLLRAAMGAAVWDVTGSRNEFTSAATVPDSLTLAIEKSVSVWEMNGGKVNTMEISGSMGSRVTMTLGLIFANMLRTGDAGIVNNTAGIAALANTNEPPLLQLDDAIFRADVHGAALTSADQMNITEFKLSINNNLSDPTFATPLASVNPKVTLEPIRNGKREVMLDITIPRYESDAFFTYLNASTPIQIDLKFLFGTDEFNIYLPNCVVMSGGAPVAGQEILTQTFTIKALVNGSTNTDMAFASATAITQEIGIETKNERTGVPA